MKKISDLGVLLLAVAIFSGCGKAESRYVETHAVSSASTTAQDTLPLAGDTASENQSERLAVADGRKEENASNATAADTKFINRVFKQSEAAILKLSKFGCDKGTKQGVDVKGIVKGSFTKPETQETAYLYERCRAGRGFGIGGLVIASGDVVSAHYVFGENGLYWGISSPGDINGNGTDEIALKSIGSGQGYTEASVVLVEAAEGNMNALGSAAIYSSNGGAAMSDADRLTTGWDVTVGKGEVPVFYRDTYEMRGSATKWSLAKKNERFDLDKADITGILKVAD